MSGRTSRRVPTAHADAITPSRGLPYWLREVPDIVFRTNNEQYKMHMEKFVNLIVKKLKDTNLFASHSKRRAPAPGGGIQRGGHQVHQMGSAFGPSYQNCCAVDYVQAYQIKVPGEVIPTCNGRYCGETWPGPLNKTKLLLWTENWTTQ